MVCRGLQHDGNKFLQLSCRFAAGETALHWCTRYTRNAGDERSKEEIHAKDQLQTDLMYWARVYAWTCMCVCSCTVQQCHSCDLRES